MTASMTKVKGREDSPIILRAHIKGLDGLDINQASLQSIYYRTFEYGSESNCEDDINGTEVGTQASLDKTSVVFDELQTGNGWTADDEGYNFAFALPKARLPNGNKWVRVEVWMPPVVGEEFLGALFGILVGAVAKS